MKMLDSFFGRAPSPDAFANLFIDAARRQGYAGTLAYNADEFRLENANRAVINLHTAYRAYCEGPRAERRHTLQRFVKTLCKSRRPAPDTFADACAMLRPLIRCRAMIDEVGIHKMRHEGRLATYSPAWRAFGDDCAVLLGLDYADSTSTLMSGPPADWGITLDNALQIACDNLRDVTADRFVEVARGVYRGDWNDGYDASRVLMPDLLHRVPVRGRPAFMIPTRDTLLICGDRDEDALARMIELAHDASRNGRPVSPFLYRCDDEGTHRFTPSRLQSAQRLAYLVNLYRRDEYDTQKRALDRLHQMEGRDLFTASLMLYGQNENGGETFTATTWTSGVHTLLPKADRVVLIEMESGATRVVTWAQLEALVGTMLEKTPMVPARYRTHGFPSSVDLPALTHDRTVATEQMAERV